MFISINLILSDAKKNSKSKILIKTDSISFTYNPNKALLKYNVYDSIKTRCHDYYDAKRV